MHEPAFLSVDPKMLKADERIIVASMRVFAKYPLEKASLRMIAHEADISFSAITYYFKTKENLYREVLTRILDYVVSSSPGLHEELPPNFTPADAKKEVREIVTNLAERMYGNSKAALLAQILLREHISPSGIYETIYDRYFKKIITRITRLIQILGDMPNERRATLQAFSVIGQMLAFRVERELMVRKLGMTGFSSEEIEELKELLIENIFRQLGVEP